MKLSKANRLLPRECTDHSKHPLPTTQEMTLHTHTLPDGQYQIKIEYILCSWRWRSSISTVQFSCSVLSDYMRPHVLQHDRLPCPSPTPGTYSNSGSLSWWCHPTISSSVIPFSSCPQSFPASGSFPMSQFFISDGQSIGVSTSASVLPMNIQDWFPLGWTGWISLHARDSQESCPTLQFKSISSLALSFLYSPTFISIHDHWKNHSLD